MNASVNCITVGCSKHVHVRKKHVIIRGANMTCFAAKYSKFGVAVVVDFINVYTLQNIYIYTIRIISGGKCAISEREICPKVEKSKILADHTDQKHINPGG